MVKMMGDKKQSFNHDSAILNFEKLTYGLYIILPRCTSLLIYVYVIKKCDEIPGNILELAGLKKDVNSMCSVKCN